MPTIIPGYVYSLFAALIVGTLIVCACSLVTLNIKTKAERQQLTNIDQYIATQSLSLLSQTTGNNQNITQFLQIPANIGNKQYWIALSSDSSGAWIESGFGTTVIPSQPAMHIPAKIDASGVFVSNSGRAFLKSYIENQTVILTLTGE